MSRRENKIIGLHQQIEQERQIASGLRAQLAQANARAEQAEQRAKEYAADAKRHSDLRVEGNEAYVALARQAAAMREALRKIQDSAADDIRCGLTDSPCIYTIEAEARAALSPDAGHGWVPRAELEKAQRELAKEKADGLRDIKDMQRRCNGFYGTIVDRMQPFFPADTRDLEWDVLPGTIGGVCRERDEWKAKAEAANKHEWIIQYGIQNSGKHEKCPKCGMYTLGYDQRGRCWQCYSQGCNYSQRITPPESVADENLCLRRRLVEAVEALKEWAYHADGDCPCCGYKNVHDPKCITAKVLQENDHAHLPATSPAATPEQGDKCDAKWASAWFRKAYMTMVREGWEDGATFDEVSKSLLSVLCNMGYGPDPSKADLPHDPATYPPDNSDKQSTQAPAQGKCERCENPATAVIGRCPSCGRDPLKPAPAPVAGAAGAMRKAGK